jgi:hypothetical protein
MKDLTGRLERLEARAGRRSGLSSERRKYLTDRAVLHGDQEALAELELHRPDTIVGFVEQRAAAIAAGIRVCHRATEVRLSKLEANVPPPASPFDGLTIDELSVFLLEEYSEVLARDDMPEEIRADAKRHVARITGQITETVNFASGRWAMMPGFDNYQEHLDGWRKRWEKVRPDESEFVPSLNHNIEGDGFGRPDPVTPDLMARRSKLWAHPIVKQIVKEAPTKDLPSRTSLHECKSFQNGRPGKSSDNCAPQCMRECLNSRRGGFKALDRSTPERYH